MAGTTQEKGRAGQGGSAGEERTSPSSPRAHEERDANVKRLFFLGFGLLGLLVAIILLIWGVEAILTANRLRPVQQQSAFFEEEELPPLPRLQVTPALDLQKLLAREDSALGGYGWIDEKAGIARVPVERAIDELLLRQRQGTGGGDSAVSGARQAGTRHEQGPLPGGAEPPPAGSETPKTGRKQQ